MVVKSKFVSEHKLRLSINCVWAQTFSKSWGSINCVWMRPSVLLEWAPESFWDTWWPTGELRWTQTKLRPLITCNHLEIPKRYRNLNKWKEFEWTDECIVAFQQLKQYLSRPPIMSSPVVDEVLFAYIAVAFYTISFVLIRADSGIQRSVYYVSRSLNEVDVRYLPLKKAILAVVHTIN